MCHVFNFNHFYVKALTKLFLSHNNLDLSASHSEYLHAFGIFSKSQHFGDIRDNIKTMTTFSTSKYTGDIQDNLNILEIFRTSRYSGGIQNI